MTLKINGTTKAFIVNTRSLVTIIPPNIETTKDKKKFSIAKNNRTLIKTKLNSSGRSQWKPRVEETGRIH